MERDLEEGKEEEAVVVVAVVEEEVAVAEAVAVAVAAEKEWRGGQGDVRSHFVSWTVSNLWRSQLVGLGLRESSRSGRGRIVWQRRSGARSKR